MIKLVLDTNVFMSGIFWAGHPARILDAWSDEKIKLIVSPEILNEYVRVGNILSKKYPGVDISPFIDLTTIYGEFVSPAILKGPVSRDADDDKFIATALAAKCKLIVSGDKEMTYSLGRCTQLMEMVVAILMITCHRIANHRW